MLFKKTFVCLFISILALSIGSASAEDAKLPKGKEVLTRFFKAIGGEDKLAQLKSTKIDAQVNFLGAGVKGTSKTLMAEGNKFKQVMELEGVGSESAGSDGKTVWAMSAITGARLLSGSEAEQYILSNGHAVPQIHYPKYFDSIECTGIEKFDDFDCYVVKYIKADRKPMLDYFEKETGLLRGSRQNMMSQQGEIEVKITTTDYRDVDGIKYAHSGVMELGPGLALELKISSLELNPKLAANEFDLPADVAALKK